MTALISLSFRKRSGKDTVADYLVDSYGFEKISWAGLLKDGINIWHGWDNRHAYGALKEKIDPYFGYSPREAYQKIGTDLMRNQWRDTFWVDCSMKQIEQWLNDGKSVAITDSRFPNEIRTVRKVGGFAWEVRRPSLPAPNPLPNSWLSKFRAWTQGESYISQFDHISETALLGWTDWDATIYNTGTVLDLYRKVDELAEEIGLKKTS